MAENPLKQLPYNELRELAALQRSGQLPPAAVVGMGFDPQTFDTDLREALREGMRVPYAGPPGAPPVPPRAEPAPAPAPTLPAPASDIADRILRRMIPIEPPAPPTEVDIFRSTGARPPRLTPEMLASQQAEEATMAGPPQVGEGVRAIPTAPPAAPADPYAAVRQYLGGGAGMGGIPGPTKFTMPTRPADLNEEEARRKLSAGMPGEREAQETYKADPYMTMLQTGLRILAAEPKLGQSAISAIAGPVAEGTEKYMTEKEKERLSKREEAKEAREEAYRRFGAQRDITSKLLDVGEAAKTRDLQYQKARFDVEKGVSDEALKRLEVSLRGSENAIRRAELEFKVAVQRQQIPPQEVFAIVQRLETQAQPLERIPEEQRTPEQRAELESIRRMQSAVQRTTGAYLTADARRDVAATGAQARGDAAAAADVRARMESIRRRMADIQRNDIDYQRNPEWVDLRQEFRSLGGIESEPTRPPPPRPSR